MPSGRAPSIATLTVPRRVVEGRVDVDDVSVPPQQVAGGYPGTVSGTAVNPDPARGDLILRGKGSSARALPTDPRPAGRWRLLSMRRTSRDRLPPRVGNIPPQSTGRWEATAARGQGVRPGAGWRHPGESMPIRERS
jgi:hypothetical protein